ncbi:hypothetical protein ACLOJK_001490 [Asimina triloba]
MCLTLVILLASLHYSQQLQLRNIVQFQYQYANYSTPNYAETGKGKLKFRLINQRYDFAFALVSGGLSNLDPVFLCFSLSIVAPKARGSFECHSICKSKGASLPSSCLGKSWDEMTVTWTSDYDVNEAVPFVEWGLKEETQMRSPAGTLTFTRSSMYTYRLGHRLFNGTYVWSKQYSFKAPPFPGQNSLQRVIVFGDTGKAERDGSNEYQNYQPGALNTTDTLVNDLDNFDIVFHIGDMSYADGFLSQWDQFTEMVEPIASTVPYMVARYAADYGMFHFCIADSEHDWREGTEQYQFIEKCLASADRAKQPWLIFAAHRVLGYSSNAWYAQIGAFGEPMGRDDLQKLWQKYRVDIAFFGHVHSYERTCPIFQNTCVSPEKSHYSGVVNGTIHVVVGGGGSHLAGFTDLNTDGF